MDYSPHRTPVGTPTRSSKRVKSSSRILKDPDSEIVDPSNSDPEKEDELTEVQRLLDTHYSSVSTTRYIVEKRIGEGTFSSVYLVRDHNDRSLAVKHLIPTASSDRVLTEIESLRLATRTGDGSSRNNNNNVISLSFCYRIDGDVLLGMPYVPGIKFGELIQIIDYEEMKSYLKNLLIAVAHIHSLNIIHRDIKPANFLYDRVNRRFALCDFGLAQRVVPSRKRKFSGDSPRKRSALTNVDLNEPSQQQQQQQRTPKKKKRNGTESEKPPMTEQFYDSRGAILKTPPKSIVQAIKEIQRTSCSPSKRRKTMIAGQEEVVRRSPRKHPSSSTAITSGRKHSKLTISGSTITGGSGTTSVVTPSFTILDPASGVPSAEGTLRQASLTSRHSLGGGTSTLTTSALIAQRFNTPSLLTRNKCSCFGTPNVCPKCLSRRSQKAARAGTPGFRPPEVLLKSEYQTTAVDMWAVGVVMLCLLSRSYPFFRAPDDVTALAEIMVLFGSRAIEEAACQYGKKLLCNPTCSPVDLKVLCARLCKRECPVDEEGPPCLATTESIEFMMELLNLLASDRITAQDALNHPFLEGVS